MGVVAFFLLMITQVKAFTTIRETVKTVDSIAIEILINIPDGDGQFPVLFFVHGGGWDHGTRFKTPGATNIACANALCDNLGIVFIGIDYRCKNQNGNFDKAYQDVMDVYAYALKNAQRFKCNFQKVGFAGASAGTPLSAIAAQNIAACKLYIGIYGKYDFVNQNLGGYWPNKETLEKFQIVQFEQQKRASAIAQIRVMPPATLLIHGKADATIGHKQSEAFAEAIKTNKGYAKVLLLANVPHGFYKVGNSQAYKTATLEIMEHLIHFFEIDNPKRELVLAALNNGAI